MIYPEEKWNKIIQNIEELIEKNYKCKNSEILQQAFADGGIPCGEKEQRIIFRLIIDKPPVEYMRERRMTAVYKYIAENGFSAEDYKNPYNICYDIAGVIDERSLRNGFFNLYRCYPEDLDRNLSTISVRPPLTWEFIHASVKDEITNLFSELDKKGEQKAMSVESIMEIIKSHGWTYDLMNQYELERQEELCQLNDTEKDFAVQLANDNSFSYAQAFDYVYNYCWYYIDLNKSNPLNLQLSRRDETLEYDLSNKEVIDLYFNKDFSFDEIHLLLEAKEDACLSTSKPATDFDFTSISKEQCEMAITCGAPALTISNEHELKYLIRNDGYEYYIEAEYDDDYKFYDPEAYYHTRWENMKKKCEIDKKNYFIQESKVKGIVEKARINSVKKLSHIIDGVYSLGIKSMEERIRNGGYDDNGYNHDGFNKEGLDRHGFDTKGFNEKHIHKITNDKYNLDGFDFEGFDRFGLDKEHYNRKGLDLDRYDKDGFDEMGYDREGYDKKGFNKDGINKITGTKYNVAGFDKDGNTNKN